METLQRCQTIAPDAHRVLRLAGSELPTSLTQNSSELVGVLSPYFQRSDFEGGGSSQEYSFILALMKIIIGAPVNDGSTNPGLGWQALNGTTGAVVDSFISEITGLNGNETAADVFAKATANIIADAGSLGHTVTADDLIWIPNGIIPAAPKSYQTIVTQTGTAAPAVTGTFSPTSTYPSGTTFTWARTGAGVYTLTASTAVFDTTGKTGVFVGSLNNPNGAYKTVVTSSTVITFTFYVQSLAVLGLLGFTSMATDALLTQTMVYVQTYS